MRGYDNGFRLMRQRRVAAYKNLSASDIVRKLAAGTACRSARSSPRRPCPSSSARRNITDWDFLGPARGREREGRCTSTTREVPVRQAEARLRCTLAESGDKSPYVLEGGQALLRCRAAFTAADQVAKVSSRGWDIVTKQNLIGRAAPATSNPDVLASALTPGERGDAVRRRPSWSRPAPRTSGRPRSKSAAEALADDVTSSFAELEVVVRGNPEAAPRQVPVTLEQGGTPFDGAYTVTGRPARVRDTAPTRPRCDQRPSVPLPVRPGLRRLRRGGRIRRPGRHRPPDQRRGQRGRHRHPGPAAQGRVKLRSPGWTTTTSATGPAPSRRRRERAGGLEPDGGSGDIPVGFPDPAAPSDYAVNDEVGRPSTAATRPARRPGRAVQTA